MRTLLTASLALFLTAQFVTAGNPIRFSADITEFTGEGVVYRRLTFKEDKHTISYLLPQGWACSLNDNVLRLTPPEKSFAEGQIQSVALDTPKLMDETAIAALTQNVLTALPPDSQQTTVVKQEQNPMLGNNPGFELVVSYKVLGDTFQRGVIFVNTPANQLVFKFTARKSDFDPLYRAFRSSVFTWEWVKPESSHDQAITSEPAQQPLQSK